MGLAVVAPDPGLPTVRGESAAGSAFDPTAGAEAELDRQVRTYQDLGLFELAGLPAGDIDRQLPRLREQVSALDPVAPADDVPPADHVPFVLVLGPGAVRVNDWVPAMRQGLRRGMSVIDDDEARTYRPVDGLRLPPGPTYLVTGLDVGSRWVNVTPEAARTGIERGGRTPLTIEEGLALVTVRPDMLRPNRCFSLAASRTGTNQRVPAIWISRRRPKLGWCWDRNPHSWLGTASAAGRV